MAQKWYPVIDYELCVECGTCSSNCPHGVYNLEKSPTPVVVNPLSCVDHCHGCGNNCPVGAITYVGDDTGWLPLNGKNKEQVSGCSCSCNMPPVKKVVADYLFLDMKTCDRCMGTGEVLDKVMAKLTPVLEMAGYAVEYNKIEMTTAEIAGQYHFLSSPTIRVNGNDICAAVNESNCGCCSEISGTDIDCRTFEYDGKSYEVPPAPMLAEAILKGVFAPKRNAATAEYTMPENLRNFFRGKSEKQGCHCGTGCC